MIKLKQKLWAIKYLPATFVATFFGFMMYQVLFPSVPSEAASTATAKLSAEVEPVIEIALDTSALALSYDGETSIVPTSAGVTATGDVNVYVSTNSPKGYELYTYTSDTTTDMKHSNSNVETAISAVSGDRTEAQGLDADTWGFKFGSLGWKAVGADEAHAALVTETSKAPDNGLCNNIEANYASCYAAGTADKQTVTFGAKLTDSLPAGSYTNHVVFSAIAKLPAEE